jgi:exopolyphosphatase/guanosine-5'-triphosphate,3'-diphosphate pyrophosphatase
MADALRAIVPDPNWKKMKKAGKRLFQKLGDLRDTQVMMEWVERLDPADAGMARTSPERESKGPSPASSQSSQNSGDTKDSAAAQKAPPDQEARNQASQALLEILSHREDEQKHEAKVALDEFDRKQWRQWSKFLPQRATRFRPGSSLFKHLALERWTEARELHHCALRNRSQAAFHGLRIGIKRFRYVVENFLPAEHKAWSDQLKQIQDLLGEVHDLDVLWTTALSCRVFPNEDSKKRWHARILEERTKRIERYRHMMTGPNALWHVWRKALPQGKQIQAIATQRMKLWAQALDPDFSHSERVAALAVELYDGLSAAGLLGHANGTVDGVNARSSLLAAALLHDVGKSKRDKGHHKVSFKLINGHGAPLGWNPEDIKCAAVVARFHQGALPTKSHKTLRDLLPNEQKTAMQLAAILRLANALDATHDGRIRHAQVEQKTGDHNKTPSCIIVGADGYSVRSATARTVAAERYLLETILRRPVIIKPLKPLA